MTGGPAEGAGSAGDAGPAEGAGSAVGAERAAGDAGSIAGAGSTAGAERAAGDAERAAGDGGRGPIRLVWVRVRLRTAPGAALALCLLVLATAFLAAALPRAVDRYENDAVHQALRQAPPRERGVSIVDTYQPATSDDHPLGPAALDRVEKTFQQHVRPPLRLLTGQTAYGVRTGEEAAVPDPGLAHTTEHDPAAVLVAQAGYAARVRVVSGRLPHAWTGTAEDDGAVGDGTDGTGTAAGAVAGGTDGTGASADADGEVDEDADGDAVEGVVTEQTARTLHLAVGRTVHLSTIAARPLPVRVTGIVAPRDPAALWWNEDPDLLRPQLAAPTPPPGETPKTYWHFTVLVDRTAAESFPLLGVGADLYWHHPMDIGRLSAHEVPALQRELSSFESGPDAAALQGDSGGVHLSDSAGFVLDTFTAERAAASPLVLIAAVGVGATAAAVLLMTGGLAADRRRTEIALLRSRGGSLRAIALRLAGETAAAAVPGGAAGTLLALALLRTDRWTTATALGAAVTAVAVLALPLRAAWAVRRPRPAGGREDLAVARPSRRRLVVELTTAVVVVGAVVALRQRGTGGGGGSGPAAGGAGATGAIRIWPPRPSSSRWRRRWCCCGSTRCRCGCWPARRRGCAARSPTWAWPAPGARRPPRRCRCSR
ncbi:hypothetical protein VSR01_12360 [Actinacidiphila sp. DG2A-62]|uniref:hypothetical protein n=1 Tax=Actinacidiphila sp. DG2A-62 TaxID=3108821 RepID=UPI002DB9CC47|nr:hypothetical protein [Actinacidiphila sp. DG2A-62]MEC3994289.1 hypothetical protein [Actinacidiphila sp. DG2A-62]